MTVVSKLSLHAGKAIKSLGTCGGTPTEGRVGILMESSLLKGDVKCRIFFRFEDKKRILPDCESEEWLRVAILS
jgi:hypothetical protein